MEDLWNAPAWMVVTASAVAVLVAGVGVWRWKKITAMQAAFIATAVAIGAASIVLVMVQVYRGDELGRAISWIEQIGVAIAGVSLGAFALCFVCLVTDLIERVRKRLKRSP
jgi:hypothetical protein